MNFRKVPKKVLLNDIALFPYQRISFAIALAALTSVSAGVSTLAASAPMAQAAAATKGSITLDTAQYIMAPGNRYDIGAFIKNASGKQLTAAEMKALVAQGKLKVSDSRTGSIVKLEQLSSGHFRVTGKKTGTCYIVYDIGGTHASVRVDVQNGVKQHGTAVRNTSYLTIDVLTGLTVPTTTTPSTRPTTSTPSTITITGTSSHPSELIGVWSKYETNVSESNPGEFSGMILNERGVCRQGTIIVQPGMTALNDNHVKYLGNWEVKNGFLTVVDGNTRIKVRYTIEGNKLTLTKSDGNILQTFYRVDAEPF